MEVSQGKILNKNFYRRKDVARISKELLGKVLCTQFDGEPVTSGIITETEAYCGRNDKACHANGKRTERTEVMYHDGGVAYVYLCYGIHHLFNIVTNVEGQADAVLIRAIEPLKGIEYMMQRRGKESLSPELTAGPGRLSQALGIRTDHYGTDLTGGTIWIEKGEQSPQEKDIESSPRIGVEYAGADAQRPWRFFIRDSKWVS